MESLTKTILAVAIMLCVGLSATPARAVMTVDLMAGQTHDAGDLVVWNDGPHLWVSYQTVGWLLVETHLAVACDVADIPQTKKGNPKIGHFPYADSHEPPVAEHTYQVPLPACATAVIAAHAVVVGPGGQQTLTLLSGDDVIDDTDPFDVKLATLVVRRRVGDDPLAYLDPACACDPPQPARLAWVHPSWDNPPDTQALLALGARWIWESFRVMEPIYGNVARMSRTIEIPGAPLSSSSLSITCDNGYEAFVNGVSVGKAQTLGGVEADPNPGDCDSTDWCDSSLRQACVNTNNWATAESWPVGDLLHSGANTLTVDGVNESFIAGQDGHNSDGNVNINPGACLYALWVDYADPGESETAWAGGEDGMDFGGRSWATYCYYSLD